MVATTNQDKSCKAGEGREGVISEECEDRGSEVTAAVKANNTDT